MGAVAKNLLIFAAVLLAVRAHSTSRCSTFLSREIAWMDSEAVQVFLEKLRSDISSTTPKVTDGTESSPELFALVPSRDSKYSDDSIQARSVARVDSLIAKNRADYHNFFVFDAEVSRTEWSRENPVKLFRSWFYSAIASTALWVLPAQAFGSPLSDLLSAMVILPHLIWGAKIVNWEEYEAPIFSGTADTEFLEMMRLVDKKSFLHLGFNGEDSGKDHPEEDVFRMVKLKSSGGLTQDLAARMQCHERLLSGIGSQCAGINDLKHRLRLLSERFGTHGWSVDVIAVPTKSSRRLRLKIILAVPMMESA